MRVTMKNKQFAFAFGGIFAAMVAFMAGINALDGDRAAQTVVAVVYVAVVVILARRVRHQLG